MPYAPLCIVCNSKPHYAKGGKEYPTCGLTCAEKLKSTSTSMCIVCHRKPSYCKNGKQYPTCGLTCASSAATLCDYCFARPKLKNYPHCGKDCRNKAKEACLMCRRRPKLGRYHLCGKTCKDSVMQMTPLLLEVPPGHMTFQKVETKFKKAWDDPNGTACPSIRNVYKVFESQSLLDVYDAYRNNHGNECFRYHGTGRQCQLGDPGQTSLCKSSSCAVCSILETSFKVSLSNPGGAFGPGIYTSSASNKSASYSPNGVMFLTKVVLGKVRTVNNFNEVMSCPPGCNSVVFDRYNGRLNETVVYTDDAIRPVFLIVFG